MTLVLERDLEASAIDDICATLDPTDSQPWPSFFGGEHDEDCDLFAGFDIGELTAA